jgi:hypothetical protein
MIIIRAGTFRLLMCGMQDFLKKELVFDRMQMTKWRENEIFVG